MRRNLQVSGYIRSPSKGTTGLNVEELEVFRMLRRAVLIALYHTRWAPAEPIRDEDLN
jgi:hypothetical protein